MIRLEEVKVEEVVERAREYGIELPFMAETQLRNLAKEGEAIPSYSGVAGEWIEIREEDENAVREKLLLRQWSTLDL
ncbi:hypothetical protein [Rhizobium johnstonii]|uniref:hypothetical protein n=1 Tax=Rhizobium johnstonii TaxID=3019933 RepID=UPI003F98D99D